MNSDQVTTAPDKTKKKAGMFDITDSMMEEFKVNADNPYDMNFQSKDDDSDNGDSNNNFKRKQKLHERNK